MNSANQQQIADEIAAPVADHDYEENLMQFEIQTDNLQTKKSANITNSARP